MAGHPALHQEAEGIPDGMPSKYHGSHPMKYVATCRHPGGD